MRLTCRLDALCQFKDQPAAEQIGTLIGPYKLLEQIGEGGMGLVYMAEQQQPVRRLVALKLIKPGMDSKQVIARFEAERQALAMMDHPNIAKVHDAGATETGRPYFVMELVRGIPLNEFCDQKRLAVRERLQIFVQVCQAVQHAHQKGIIHRDLKPTNVLVTMADTVAFPKLLDFGIAKALGQSLTDSTLHTGYAQLVGTPLYMSPEQAEMNLFGVDTRSDVYSLGVLLYELLTGTTPFDKGKLTKANFDEMRRIIREDDPPRPSARMSTLKAQALSTISQQRNIDPRRVSAMLRGELDWIVMKALEKDRGRRYESASALAADIQRYLSDEPVLACPPTTMYRFQKFARKHKPALFTAAVIAASLLLGTTVSAWQAVRASTAEAQATANEVEAKSSAKKAAEKAQEATTQRDEVQRQRDEIQRQRDEVSALADRLSRTLYAANMNLAQHAWDAGVAGRVEQLLEEHRPKPGETDLRGFEWYYLHRLCHPELLLLKGHIGYTPADQSVAFSPDGKRIAFGSRDWDETKKGFVSTGDVKVWDVQSGRELLTCKGHTSGVYYVAYSPDGKLLAGASRDNTVGVVTVWDAHTGLELHSVRLQTGTGPVGFVYSVAFSPNNKRLAIGRGTWDGAKNAYVSGEVQVCDALTGQRIFDCTGHTRYVASAAFSPDGTRLVSGSEDSTIRVWDAETGKELLMLKGHTDGIHSVTFSPDGKRLASGGNSGGKVWNAQTGQELFTLQGETGQVNSVSYSPDGKRLASGGLNKSVRVWDAQTGQELASFKGHSGSVNSVLFSPDATRLASGSSDGTVRIWDARVNSETRPFSEHTDKVRILAFSPDGNRLAGAAFDPMAMERAVKVWDVQSGQELLSLKVHGGPGPVMSLGYSPDGKRLAFGYGVWDSSKRAYVAGEVKLWDAETGQEFLTIKGHTAAVGSLVFSPDSTRLASSCSQPSGRNGTDGSGEVKVWDARTGQELLTLKGHSRFVTSVAYSPDGKHLATNSRDNTVKVWNVQTGQEIRSLKANNPVLGSVAFSPDGKRLVSSAASSQSPRNLLAPGEAKVWDVESGDELVTLSGHTSSVSSVAFSPDGRRLVSTARSIKVWDAQTGRELLTFNDDARTLAFSPNGHRLAAISAEGVVTIYDATPLPEKP